jgi:hypothetical protein
MCFIRSNDSSLIPMYCHKKNKKLNKEVFNKTFIMISKYLTILKYTSRSNPNTPFSTSKSSETKIFRYFNFVFLMQHEILIFWRLLSKLKQKKGDLLPYSEKILFKLLRNQERVDPADAGKSSQIIAQNQSHTSIVQK